MDETVEKLRLAYTALGEGDADAALAMLAEDCEWRESAELPDVSVIHGRAAVAAFLHSFLESWESFDQAIEDVRIEGDRALLLIHLRAVGRSSGIELDARYAHLWTIRDGVGVAVDAYRDQADALAAFERASASPAAPRPIEQDQKAT